MDNTFSKQNKKIVVGMSGGVDSSVAAVLLKEQGYDVIGVHMKYWSEKDEYSVCDNGIVNNDPSRANACCSLDSLEDARRVCSKLDIPLYVVDFKEKFKEKIVDYFIAELKQGFTPNACVVCNREVKFGLLMDYALSIGADYVGTGHYAQIIQDADTGRFGIKRAIDENKDQSYFLSLLTQKQLSKIILPLGALTKDKVREIAAANGLVNSKRRDSQDLCFVAHDYKSFVGKYAESRVGDIVLKNTGEVIGQHSGLVFYTLGQRKGFETKLNIALYVVGKDFENNKLIVDTQPQHGDNEIRLKDFNWVSTLSSSPIRRGEGEVFIGRYQGMGNEIQDLEQVGDDLIVKFSDLKTKFANGQYGAIYKDDVLIGAGKIIST